MSRASSCAQRTLCLVFLELSKFQVSVRTLLLLLLRALKVSEMRPEPQLMLQVFCLSAWSKFQQTVSRQKILDINASFFHFGMKAAGRAFLESNAFRTYLFAADLCTCIAVSTVFSFSLDRMSSRGIVVLEQPPCCV